MEISEKFIEAVRALAKAAFSWKLIEDEEIATKNKEEALMPRMM
ncbi:MAG: hypothetical protein WC575_01030 [Patescibacteria group bacterium]